MKKIFVLLNVLCFAVAGYCFYRYFGEYSPFNKGLASASFVLIGGINLLYYLLGKHKKHPAPFLLFIGLAVCMVADIVIITKFIPGAVIFAVGHILYIASFFFMRRSTVKDYLIMAVAVVFSVLFILYNPFLYYGSPLLTAVAVIYAVVLSAMLGKCLANLICSPSASNAVLFAGCLLFFVSDIALAFNLFTSSFVWANTLCLATYFPGQCLIGLSVFFHKEKPIN